MKRKRKTILDSKLIEVGYFLSRCGIDGPPAQLETKSWKNAILCFYEEFGNDDSEQSFYNRLKNIRDHFDSHIDNSRRGWHNKDGIPDNLPEQYLMVLSNLENMNDNELWDYLKKYANISFTENKHKNESNMQKESSLEEELHDTKTEINKLNKELEQLYSKNQKTEELEKIIKQYEKDQFNIEKEIEFLKIDEKRILETIGFVETIPEQQINAFKTKVGKRIDFFDRIGTISLTITSATFIGSIYYLIGNQHTPTNLVMYLNNVFFVIFPAIIAFASFRQSNIKSIELEKKDEQLLNSNYLVGSLKAIHKVSAENERDKNLLTTINKIIDSILKTKDEKKENEKEEKFFTASELSTILKNVTSIAK